MKGIKYGSNSEGPGDADELFNTQLRDNYSSFDDLCSAYDLDAEEMKKKLSAIDYHYDADRNQFV